MDMGGGGSSGEGDNHAATAVRWPDTDWALGMRTAAAMV